MQEVDLSVITLKCNGCMEYIEAKGQCVIARCVHIFCEWRAAAGGGGGKAPAATQPQQLPALMCGHHHQRHPCTSAVTCGFRVDRRLTMRIPTPMRRPHAGVRCAESIITDPYGDHGCSVCGHEVTKK